VTDRERKGLVVTVQPISSGDAAPHLIKWSDMAQANGISKLAGGAGSLMAAVGILLFFLGIFGMPRTFAFVGLALIASALVAFFVEEQGQRRAG
jgi:hypothetical protein